MWSWQGQLNGPLSGVQWQALGNLGTKLQPLRKGLQKLKQSMSFPAKQTGIRAGFKLCGATECWAGKLRQEACPPSWADPGVHMQASDSYDTLAIQP